MPNKYEIIHDNLNGQWFIVDLSNKKYKFYYRYNPILFKPDKPNKHNTSRNKDKI